MSKIGQEQQMEIQDNINNGILCTAEDKDEQHPQWAKRHKFDTVISEGSPQIQQSKQQNQFICQKLSVGPNKWFKNTDLLSKIDNNGQYKTDGGFKQHERKGEKGKQRQYALYYLNNNPTIKHLKDCQYHDYQQVTFPQDGKYQCNCKSQYMFSSILLHTQDSYISKHKHNRRTHTSDSICNSAQHDRNQSKLWFADVTAAVGIGNRANHKKYSNMRYLFNKINQINTNHKYKTYTQQLQPNQNSQPCVPSQLSPDHNTDIYIVNKYVKGKRLMVTSSHLSRCTMSGPVTSYTFNTDKEYIEGKKFKPNRYNFNIGNKLYNFNGIAGKSRIHANGKESQGRNINNILYISDEQSARQVDQQLIHMQPQPQSKQKPQHYEQTISHLIKSKISAKGTKTKAKLKNSRQKDIKQQKMEINQHQQQIRKQKQKVRELISIQQELAQKQKITKYYESTFANTYRYLNLGENCAHSDNNIANKDTKSDHRGKIINQQAQQKREKEGGIKGQKKKNYSNIAPSLFLNQIMNQNNKSCIFDHKKNTSTPQIGSKCNTVDHSRIKSKYLDALQIDIKHNCAQLKRSNKMGKVIR